MRVGAGAVLSDAALLVRDNRWLNHLLERIWDGHFTDTPRANAVRVNFGAPWKCRLGLITMSHDESTTYIMVNCLLRALEVPEYVTRITIAHEMVHYAHGFGSPLPQRYKHPHRGGIVKRELHHRGMKSEFERYDAWINNRWYDFYAERMQSTHRPSELIRPGQVASELPADEGFRHGY
jgi:hypothetical protein